MQTDDIDRKFALKGQIVMTSYNKRFYRIDAIEDSLNPDSSFSNTKGESMTYYEYYLKKYNLQI
jgi:aubergine-like protein